MEKLKERIPVLRSPRFWAIVLASLGVSIKTHDLTSPDVLWTVELVVDALLLWGELVLTGAVAVRTVDRHGEKKKAK